MQDQHLFEYAVVRVVPRVEREEFVNAGVVLYCGRRKFLKMRFLLDEERLTALFPRLDLQEVKQYLDAFERICLAAPGSGTIGRLPPAERFRWLIATRSTVVQTSRVHPGLCADPESMLNRLFDEMVR